MAKAEKSTLYTLHVQLKKIDPPIWRRLAVPGHLTLFQLHQVLQVTMGWTHSHLHEFMVEHPGGGVTYYGEPSPEDEYRPTDERLVRLAQIAPTKDVAFLYKYDFGDGWKHLITVENIETVNKEDAYPWCLDGQRACPPEDVGGVSGYAHFLEAWRNRSHPDHQDMRQWVGTHFQPEVFSVMQVNSAICMLLSIWSREAERRRGS